MAGARTWRWVPGFPIHRPPRRSSRNRIRDIVAENRMPFEPHQFLVGCITNIRWRLPACDRVITGYSPESPWSSGIPRSFAFGEMAAGAWMRNFSGTTCACSHVISRSTRRGADSSINGAHCVVSDSKTVARGLKSFLETTQADELIVSGQIFDHSARLRSFELAAAIRDSLS
jgi:hypothetical protein